MRAEKEKHLREVIANCKEHLQNYKIARSTNLGGKGWLGEQIRKHKTIMLACKHELNRMQGFDGAVKPKFKEDFDIGRGGKRYPHNTWHCGKCNEIVGGELYDWHKYCPNCGRKILWGKNEREKLEP